MQNITIGFVIAMPEEFNSLTFAFNNASKVTENNFTIYTATYNNLNIVAIISGIGKTLAAAATTYIISKYKANVIINVGSSGGVNNAKIGDIIVSDTALFYDVDVTAFGYTLGQIPQRELLLISSKNYINTAKFCQALVNTSANTSYGIVATGDSFVNNKNKIEAIKLINNNIICIEMEAASVALVCNNFNRDFIFIKKISDQADETASADFKVNIQQIEQNLSVVLHNLLNTFINHLV